MRYPICMTVQEVPLSEHALGAKSSTPKSLRIESVFGVGRTAVKVFTAFSRDF